MPDPLAALLALKQHSYRSPYDPDEDGDEHYFSSNLAEADPGLLFPSPILESGSDRRAKDQALMNYFSAPSPSMQRQAKQVADFENEQAQAYSERDPAIHQAREEALQDKLRLAGEPTRVEIGRAHV